MRSVVVMQVCFILILFQNCSQQFQSDMSSGIQIENQDLGQIPIRQEYTPRESRNTPISVTTGTSSTSSGGVTTTTTTSSTSTTSTTSTTTIPSNPPEFSAAVVNPPASVPATPYELKALLGIKPGYVLGRAQIIVSSTDVGKVGYFFFVIKNSEKTYILDPAASKWMVWDNQLVGYQTASRSLQSTQGHGEILIHGLDLNSFGGSDLYVGYGVGHSVVEAVTELFQFNRIEKVLSIEAQEFKGFLTIPFSSVSRVQPAQKVIVSYQVWPASSDYLAKGMFFVFADTPDGSRLFFNGTDWVPSSAGTPESLTTFKTDQLSNFKVSQTFVGQDLVEMIGWKIYCGYGKSFQDMIDKKTVSIGKTIL